MMDADWWRALEEQCRSLARRAYPERNRDRLFPLPDIDGADERVRDAIEERYRGRAVVVISRYHGGSDPVGYFAGFGPGIGGLAGSVTHLKVDEGLTVRIFDGISTHFDPTQIEWIYELPSELQPVPYDEEDLL